MPNTSRPSVFNSADGWDKVPYNEVVKAQIEWDMAKAIEDQNKLLNQSNNASNIQSYNYISTSKGFTKYDFFILIDILIAIVSWIYAFEFSKELNLIFPAIVTGAALVLIIKNLIKGA